MKKVKTLIIAVIISAITLSLTSCFGGFEVTKKVYDWNKSVSDEPIVQTLVMWGLNIIPVYPVAVAADIFIFNLVEFWTGDNPIAMNANDYEEQLVVYNGKTYKLKASKNKFDIEAINDESENYTLSFTFDNTNNTVNTLINNNKVTVAKYSN